MITALKTERGLALPDLLNGAFEFIDGLQLKPAARVYLLDILATIECVVYLFHHNTNELVSIRHRLAAGASEKIQLTAMLGAFKNAVEISARP